MEGSDCSTASSSKSSSRSGDAPRPPTTTYGIGRPLLGYRNTAAYAHAREGPDNRFAQGTKAAQAHAKLLQRWQPDLMLDTDCTVELLKEHYDQRTAQRHEGLGMQGNSLWIPSLVPTTQSSRLLVHAGGPILERLHLSWLTEESRKDEEEEDDEEEEEARDRPSYPSCRLSTHCWASGEVGTIRQIAPLNQFETGDRQAWGQVEPTAPPTCFVRGTSEAALLQLRHRDDNSNNKEDKQAMPYYLAPLQKLQFQHHLLDVATRPASIHRAAFLTEDLEVFEWTSAAGATRVDVNLPATAAAAEPTKNGSASSSFSSSTSSSRLAWGAHPRHLWLSTRSSLYGLDLRQKTAGTRLTTTLSPLSTGRLPKGLLGPTESAGGAVMETAAPPVVGAVERHPFDENLLFVSADEYLLALDLRQPQSPIAVLRQAEPCHLMSVGVHNDKTWLAAGCRTLPRLHLHMEEANENGRPSGLNMVEEWCTGVDWLTRSPQRRRPLQYQTSTFVNWDSTPERGQPVWLAGLGLAPSLSSSSTSTFFLPYMTSLGDVYIQRLSQTKEEICAGAHLWEAKDLPCGLSPHVRTDKGRTMDETQKEKEVSPPLPSSAFFQPYGKADHSLRDYTVAALDPPEVLFGKVLPVAPSPSSSSLGGDEAKRQEALRRVLAEHWASLMHFLEECPRSLLEVASHLEKMAPGRVVCRHVEQALRDLYHVLRVEVEESQSIAHARVSMPPPRVLRTEEGQLVEVKRRRKTNAAQEDEQEDRRVCVCDLSGSSTQDALPPCLSSSCLVPFMSLYWAVSAEALLPKTTAEEEEEEEGEEEEEEEEEQGGGGGRDRKIAATAQLKKKKKHIKRPSPLQGLDMDSIHWLRSKWHETMNHVP